MKRRIRNIESLEEAKEYILALRKKNASKNTQICVLRADLSAAQVRVNELCSRLADAERRAAEKGERHVTVSKEVQKNGTLVGSIIRALQNIQRR